MSVPQFKNLTTKQRSILALALTVLSCCAIGGVFFGDDPESAKPSKEMANDPIVQHYVKALDTIEQNYVSPPDKFRLTRGAILEMLHTLDPHSGFFDRLDAAITTAVASPMPKPLVALVVIAIEGHMPNSMLNTPLLSHRPSLMIVL